MNRYSINDLRSTARAWRATGGTPYEVLSCALSHIDDLQARVVEAETDAADLRAAITKRFEQDQQGKRAQTVIETPVPGIRRVLPVSEVLQQVKKTGYEPYFREMETGPTYFRAHILPHMLPVLLRAMRNDSRFREGLLFGLHRDVGNALTDFRAHTGTFGDGSLQLVIDQKTGACYGDVDRFSPYSDVAGFVGHSGEVIGGFWRNVKRWFA